MLELDEAIQAMIAREIAKLRAELLQVIEQVKRGD
jgi:hypothetical protein